MCGQSPLFVPTTINAMLRNIDVVDCAATNVSCTNLTVKGEPVSNVLTNIGSSAVGNTVFTGIVTADNFTTTGAVTAGSITTGNITSTGSLNLTNLTATGTIVAGTEVSATTLTGTLSTATQNNVTKIGTQTSLSNAGTLTQTGAATFATNITQSAGTSSLKAVTCDSISTTGNITQSAGTTTLNSLKINTSPTSELAYTSTAGSLGYNFTLSGNYVRFEYRVTPSTGSYTVWNAFIDATTTASTSFSGTTIGNNGNFSSAWTTTQIYMHNGGLTASIPKDAVLYGYIEFRKVSTTGWTIYGHNTFSGSSSNYINIQSGTVTTTDGKLRFNTNPTNAPLSTYKTYITIE